MSTCGICHDSIAPVDRLAHSGSDGAKHPFHKGCIKEAVAALGPACPFGCSAPEGRFSVQTLFTGSEKVRILTQIAISNLLVGGLIGAAGGAYMPVVQIAYANGYLYSECLQPALANMYETATHSILSAATNKGLATTPAGLLTSAIAVFAGRKMLSAFNSHPVDANTPRLEGLFIQTKKLGVNLLLTSASVGAAVSAILGMSMAIVHTGSNLDGFYDVSPGVNQLEAVAAVKDIGQIGASSALASASAMSIGLISAAVGVFVFGTLKSLGRSVGGMGTDLLPGQMGKWVNLAGTDIANWTGSLMGLVLGANQASRIAISAIGAGAVLASVALKRTIYV